MLLASQWDMEFNWTKCKTMPFGRGQAPNLADPDEQGRNAQERVNSFKKSKVILIPNMKHDEHVDEAVAKARSAAFLIRRVFHHLTPTVFLRAYTALVRPVLEYCIQAWSPTTLGDMTNMYSA